MVQQIAPLPLLSLSLSARAAGRHLQAARCSQAAPAVIQAWNSTTYNGALAAGHARRRRLLFGTSSYARKKEFGKRPEAGARSSTRKSADNSPSASPSASQEPTRLGTIKSKISSAASPTNLHEDIYTIPNFLTFTRLVAAPVVGYLVLQENHVWAVGLFAYAGITDLLDGWIARRWNRQTVVGTVIDPMADKALMTSLTVCLAAQGALPVWVAALILGRDVGLAIAAIYYRWISLPPPKTFARYWDFSLPSAEVRPTTISKYNTFLQLVLVGTTTAAPLVSADMGLLLTSLQYVVATTTVWSGLSYVFSKDAVKILNRPK